MFIILGAIGINLLYTNSASADSWFSTLNNKYRVYQNGEGDILYWNGRVNSWDIISSSIPQVHFNGTDCDTADSNLAFDRSTTYYNCSGLTVTAHTQSDWFEQANLAYKIADFDSRETASVRGGRITKVGSLTDATITNGGKNATSDSYGCTGGNPNRTDDCSILVIFNYGYGESFQLKLNDRTYLPSQHEYYYDGPAPGEFRTLTFNPRSGTVTENNRDSDVLWSHKASNNVNLYREYKRGARADRYPRPTRDNYRFVGWSTSASGNCRISGNCVTWRNMINKETLYAHWEPGPPVDEYDLVPSVSLDQSNAIEAGATVTVDPNVENTGNISSPSATWELNRTVNGIADFVSPVPSGAQVFPAGTTNLTDYPDSDTDFDVGTELCYTLRVRPHATGTPADEWETSDPACVTIGKKPKTQIWGGDLNVRGDVITSTSVKSSRTFGSWAEYGIVASGGISGAASGAAFAGPGLAGVTSACNYSTLSFANTSGTTCGLPVVSIGSYTNASDIPDVNGSFPNTRLPLVGNLGGNVSPASLSNGTYNAGDITLTGSNLPAGKSVVIKSTGTVRIAENQTYRSDGYTNINQLPQLVIIARNIIINSDVTTVDAWLVANAGDGSGSIHTCNASMSALTSSICNQPLVVNGPVMTDNLYLLRTAGSGTGAASGDPAEVFNMRADVYLWAFSQASSGSRIHSVYITELPPRF
jgi:uncharacterized repeat protein (TIGR02543 family)